MQARKTVAALAIAAAFAGGAVVTHFSGQPVQSYLLARNRNVIPSCTLPVVRSTFLLGQM